MEVKSYQVGPIGTNCYFVGDEATKCGCIVDPGDEGDYLVLHCPYGKPLGLSSWFEQSDYQDMLRISDGTKPLPDGPGL